MLVSCVVQLTRAITRLGAAEVPQSVRGALADLAAGTALADEDPATAAEHAAAARRQAVDLQARARSRSEVVLADIVHVCADDLQQVIERPHGQPSGSR